MRRGLETGSHLQARRDSNDTMSSGKKSGDSWWIVVMIANFGMEFLHQGYLKSVGVLLPSIVVYFDSNYSTVGFILSLEYCTYSLAAPIWRILSKRINPRCLATLGGTGTGLAIVATYFCDSPSTLAVLFFLSGFFGAAVFHVSFITLQQHLKEKFGAANAFAMIGTLLGGMLVPLFTAGLHQAYGLKGALLFLGGLFLHHIPIGLVLKAPRGEEWKNAPVLYDSDTDHMSSCEMALEDGDRAKSPQTEAQMGSTHSRLVASCIRIARMLSDMFDLGILWEERIFTFTLLPVKMILEVVYLGWAMYTVSYAMSVGVPESRAVYLPVIGAAAGLIMRLVHVLIFSYYAGWVVCVFVINQLFVIGSYFAYTFSSSYPVLAICSVIAGSGVFSVTPCFYALMSTAVAGKNFAAVLTSVMFASGIGAVMAGIFVGKLYDITGSFVAAFRVLGALMGIGLAFTGIFAYLTKIRPSTNSMHVEARQAQQSRDN